MRVGALEGDMTQHVHRSRALLSGPEEPRDPEVHCCSLKKLHFMRMRHLQIQFSYHILVDPISNTKEGISHLVVLYSSEGSRRGFVFPPEG